MHPTGTVSLFREEAPSTRPDSSLLSSISFWLLNDNPSGSSKPSTPSEIKARKTATKCVKVRVVPRQCWFSKKTSVLFLMPVFFSVITLCSWLCVYLLPQECSPEQIISESKFLQPQSLLELMKTLTFCSRGPEDHVALGTAFQEETAVFFLELLVSVAMENKYVCVVCISLHVWLLCEASVSTLV